MIVEQLKDKRAKLALVGLGYVGMPIAVAFSKKVDVIGFDINEQKISLYRDGIDPTQEVGNDVISCCNVEFTSNPQKLEEAKFFIVAVPTPVNHDHTPDLAPVEGASRIVGKHLTRGAIVVFESTVYPGVTEDLCVPILEKESGLKCGVDFKVGYSPERINPGDKMHRLETITKIVSGMDEESLEEIAQTYELVIDAGVHRAPSIQVAEAAKVIENSQRDINIAFMNELSIIFHKLGIDTKAVLQAACTKWNFLDFKPGLVGGHCIGVDPYYLTHRAEELGYHSQIILSGRRINDDMGKYVAEHVVKSLIAASVPVKGAKVAIFGFTFKEDCPDTRNTKVIDIYNELLEYGVMPLVHDPIADEEELRNFYGVNNDSVSALQEIDAVLVATGHTEFLNYDVAFFDKLFNVANEKKIMFDIKGIYSKEEYIAAGYVYWRL